MAYIRDFNDLIVYKKAYVLAMKIFEITKTFPKEEKYSLTDQIRRSSRSVTANIAEAWSKRKYIKHFVSKFTDSLGEEYETENWLLYAKDCQYIDEKTYRELIDEYLEVKKLLQSIIENPERFFHKKQ